MEILDQNQKAVTEIAENLELTLRVEIVTEIDISYIWQHVCVVTRVPIKSADKEMETVSYNNHGTKGQSGICQLF